MGSEDIIFKTKLTKKQDEFVFSHRRYPAFIGGVGTGKTMCGIARMRDLMERYPRNLGIVVRREFTDLRDSTIKDFTRYTGIDVPSNKDVILPNGSLIMFRHGDEINVLKNINAGAILIEQAEEFDTDETFVFLRDRLRRQEAGHRSLSIIANTNGHNWIYKLWKVNADKDEEFHLVEATTYDNAANLPADYIADLEKMKRTHPKHYNRFVLNSWDDEDTVDIIVLPDAVRRCAKKDVTPKKPLRRVVSVDVARYGDDKTTLYAIEGGANGQKKMMGVEVRDKLSTMETTGWALNFAKRHDINAFAVDEIGVGAGVVDRLREMKKEVVSVNNASKAEDESKYYNRRAEIYARAAEDIQQGLVEIDEADIDLIEQLSWARYKSVKSNGKLLVESKEDIKKRYGRSPDNADAFVNGLWAVERVSVVYGQQERYAGQNRSGYYFTADAC